MHINNKSPGPTGPECLNANMTTAFAIHTQVKVQIRQKCMF